MRIALAQINPIVGDVPYNSRLILDFIERARTEQAHVVVFPELAIIGYPPKDLLLRPQFIEENLQALRDIASQVRGIEVIVGYAEWNSLPAGRPLHNAVALLREGRVVARYFKTLLPAYDVFDETRYFEPGSENQESRVALIGQLPVGLSICEDVWSSQHLMTRQRYHHNPVASLSRLGAQLLINASASPFVLGKHACRLEVLTDQARRFSLPLVYVNQVGGNDELVFDGNSFALDAAGRVIAQARDFEEDLLLVDLPGCTTDTRVSWPAGRIETPASGIASVHKALVLGLRDYVRKCGFRSVVVGLSGGIDSAVTAALAAVAVGPRNVVGVAMPSRYSSEHSVADAQELAGNLGIQFHIVPIKTVHDAFEQTLGPVFNSQASRSGGTLGDDLTEQNIQARIRGVLLMAFSNRFNHLLLTTGNKSELATGYCTLYGDMCGGLAVLSDVPKTMVYELARFINHSAGRQLIPQRSITKAPSAELRPNQTDQDSLPPYDVLDQILQRYVEEEKPPAQIVADGFDAQTVLRTVQMIDRSEYKRRQAAPGLKVTSRAFGFGRRMPIAQNYRPHL